MIGDETISSRHISRKKLRPIYQKERLEDLQHLTEKAHNLMIQLFMILNEDIAAELNKKNAEIVGFSVCFDDKEETQSPIWKARLTAPL